MFSRGFCVEDSWELSFWGGEGGRIQSSDTVLDSFKGLRVRGKEKKQGQSRKRGKPYLSLSTSLESGMTMAYPKKAVSYTTTSRGGVST